MKTLLSNNEAKRLNALLQYQILDTDPEEAFDDLTTLAAQVCQTPVALINLIDSTRQWFKSKVGFEIPELPGNIGFCPFVIQQSDLLIIPDTLDDEKLATNPAVTSHPPVRFYAGAPLLTPEGYAIGTLCVVDYVPRQLSSKQVEGLQALSRQVVSQLELRRNLANLVHMTSEYQRAEQAMGRVATENLRLARAVASASDGVLITDPNQPDNPIIYTNPAYSRITGYQPEEIIGRNCRFLQGADTDPQAVAQIRRAIAERREVKATLLNYRKDGKAFWNELKISPVFSDNGDLLYFTGIQTDITDRKQAEEERDRFFTLSLDMLCIATLDGYFTRLSPAWEKTLGYTTEELQSTHLLNFVHPEDRDATIAELAHLARGTITIDFENRYRCKNGSYRWLAWNAISIPKSQLVYAIAHDITKRKQAEQKIREQAALLDITTDAILVRNLENQIVFWNKGAELMYGWKAEEAIGKHANEFLYKYISPLPLEAQRTVIAKGEWQGELHQITKDGKEVIVESRWTLVRDEEEKPKSILSVNTNITEKKQLENQFLRDRRMESIGTLAGGIAHDLNNVLTPILGAVQILQMVLPDQRSQGILDLLETNAKRGADLIKQVLSFARGVEGDRMCLQVGHLIKEIGKLIQQTFPKSIDIYTDISTTDLWLVSGDATQLHQVLMNLCVNARDAMPNGGTLKLSAGNLFIDENYVRMNKDAQVGAYILITVSDTGTGIPCEILDRIFEPFFTTKELGKGTGLGLSTVIGIIKGHGGFINVCSEVGKGTQFKVYVPAIEETSEPEQAKEKRQELPRGNGELILVVDDEASIREVTKTSLEAYNYQVLTASDGIEALALYVQHKQDIALVLIDMMMPSMDGAIAIRTLQKINSQVKIIAVSGLMLNHQLAESLGSGCKKFLSKPYTGEELLKTLSQILS